MDRRRQAIYVAACLSIAFGAGHLVQTMRANPGASAGDGTITVTTVRPVAEVTRPAIIRGEARGSLPTFADYAVGRRAARDAGIEAPDIHSEITFEPFAVACAPDLTLVGSEGGMIDLVLFAPCNGTEPVVIEHAGLVFSGMTSIHGSFDSSFPALLPEAAVSVRLADGTVLDGVLSIPEASGFTRAVLQWAGPATFSMHAYEGDVAPGAEGHIHAEAPGTPEAGAIGVGGYLTRLGHGEGDRFAEVYSHPVDARSARPVRLVVEARATPEVCGQEVTAQSLRVWPGATPHLRDLAVTMPDCDAAETTVVLKNVFEDLTLARN